MIATDLTGPFLTARAAARRMVADGRGGRIINVTSVHEHVPRLGAAAYCTAKAGLGMLTKVLALELAEHGITVNAVAPGEIATEMTGLQKEDAYQTRRPGNSPRSAWPRRRGRVVVGLPGLTQSGLRDRLLVHRRRRTDAHECSRARRCRCLLASSVTAVMRQSRRIGYLCAMEP